MGSSAWTDAETAQRTALSVYENALGREHTAYGGSLAGLCEIHLHAGRLAEAEAECREAHAIRERALGTRSLGLNSTLLLLGDMRARRGELAAADSLYSMVLSIIQERVGDESRMYDYVYPRIAALRDLQHRPAEAAELRESGKGT